MTTAPAPTLVICAGIPRSGSTWLYNAARLLLALPPRSMNDVYGTWVEHYDPANASRFHVVKVHEPDDGLLWRAKTALTSRRDLRDIAASAWKRQWISDEASTFAFLDNVVRQHGFWRGRCAFEMVYERMRNDPAAELKLIAAALGIDSGAAAFGETLRAIDALGHDESSNDDFNPANLMHKRHIMDGRVGYHAETLPAALVSDINERYRAWLRSNGY